MFFLKEKEKEKITPHGESRALPFIPLEANDNHR